MCYSQECVYRFAALQYNPIQAFCWQKMCTTFFYLPLCHGMAACLPMACCRGLVGMAARYGPVEERIGLLAAQYIQAALLKYCYSISMEFCASLTTGPGKLPESKERWNIFPHGYPQTQIIPTCLQGAHHLILFEYCNISQEKANLKCCSATFQNTFLRFLGQRWYLYLLLWSKIRFIIDFFDLYTFQTLSSQNIILLQNIFYS